MDDTPTPRVEDIWQGKHDAAVQLAEHLFAWAEARIADPIGRRSVYAHAEAKEAERLGNEAISIAWSFAAWPRSQPTLEECARAMVLLEDAIEVGERLMAGVR